MNVSSRSWRPLVVGGLALLAPGPLGPGLLAPENPSLATSACAQQAPVYVDDSIAARESLLRVRELLTAENVREAARIVQWVLDNEGDRVLEAADDTRLFEPVRKQAHDLLLSTPVLLERYRLEEEPRAKERLEQGDLTGVEHSRLLTTSGLEAALRLAQVRLEAGDFEAARLCLEQLERHPDRLKGSKDAARLALSVSRYLARPQVRQWAERWAKDAGLEAGAIASATPVNPPEGANVRLYSPLEAGTPGGLDQVGREPLISVGLGPGSMEEQEGLQAPIDNRIRDDPWAFPTIAGDVAYVNNGVDIAALDRFTLATLWRVRPPDPVFGPDLEDPADAVFTRGRSQAMEDVQSVTVAQGVVVAATGLAVGGRRDGDRRVHALRASDGGVLWSCDIAALDPTLDSTSVRGPAVVSGDTVVLSLRKRAPQRRVSSVFFAGVGLFDGNLRWVRLVGTAGIFPGGRGDRTVDASTLDRGIVYRSDELGVIAAVEAATGRPVWVRRYEAEGGWNSGPARPLFAAARPVLHEGSVYTVRPGGEEVLKIARDSGRVEDARATGTFGEARYVVRVGDVLAGVGTERVGFVGLAEFKDGPSRLTPVLRRPEISGRAVALGDRLALPISGGILLIDPAAPDAGKVVPLDSSGAAIIDGAYVLTADDTSVNAYLPWEAVDAVLRERMQKHPGDARPALALVELASKAGKPDKVITAADRALAVFDASPGSDASRAGRRKLFELLAGIVEAALVQSPDGKVIDSVDTIAARLPATVESAEERTAALLLRGRLDEQRGAFARAIDAYQQILGDESLARAVPARLSRTAQSVGDAGSEANQRVRDAVVRAGFDAYRPFEEEASRAIREAGPRASDAALAALASRYPVSTAAIEAWSTNASRELAAGRADAAIGSLQKALRAADTMVAAGRSDMLPRASALTGEVVTLLLKAERPSSAARVLASGHRPAGEAEDAQAWAPIRGALASQARDPALGRRLTSRVQVLEGWIAPEPAGVRPLSPAVGTPIDHVVLEDPRNKRIGLWAMTPDGSALELAWTRPYDGGPPRLLRVDGRDTLLFWRSTTGGRLERVSNTGEGGDWKTEDLGVWFGPVTDEQRSGRRSNEPVSVNTPQDGATRNEDLVVAADADFAAIARRGGRVGLLNLKNGVGAWVQQAPLDTVFDVAVADGLVAVSGAASVGGAALADPARSVETRVVFLETASGNERTRVSSGSGWGGSGLEGALRWMRLMAPGRLLIGTVDGMALLDIAAGKSVWATTAAPARDTTDAWVLPERAVVLDDSGDFWIFSLKDGQHVARELDGRGRFERPHDLQVYPAGSGAAVVAPRGIAVFDAGGELVGADSLGAAKELLPAVPAGGMLVTVDAERDSVPRLVPSSESDSTLDAAEVRLFELPSGRLVESRKLAMHDDPRRLCVLDGKVVISTSSVTLVVDVEDAK